ncbi:MAG: spondin domain-containing protein [Cyanobacteria bacterium P01_H01_bin.153]
MQTQLTISVENLAPENGTSLTPFWFGFHNGSFDTYDRGRPASEGLERIAEDGTTDAITNEFAQAGFGTVQGVVGAAPIGPGETVEFEVTIDGDDPGSRYFNYASMVLPSNDFFVANGNELAHEIFDEDGNFIGADFVVPGSAVLDAGTEVNDELPASTAFFGQSEPDTGTEENGVIQLAEGFIPDGRILSEPMFAEGDFTAPGYEVVRITITETASPEVVLDFEGFDAGTVISDQFAGVEISTSTEFGAMLFDTENVTGGDDDLATDDLGNVLIISEDGDGADPDDAAGGGTISFAFDDLISVESITLLDFEEEDSLITFYGEDGSVIETAEVGGFSDNELQQVSFGVDNVASFDVFFSGSGAIADIAYTPVITDDSSALSSI